ncbi:hypothetical protein RRG08_066384 [Elysia crispata]|uniref:Uncharacterized protein n=1 Tax=Elysia crispata TaxID=231223 RepID=A0AAE1B7A2_9GAST|nr:hypothetical protein RRG08_066384 [Elysia crispata]
MKNYADNKNSKPSNINIGDTVIVKQNKTNKQTLPFDPKPYVVTNMKGSMITASRGNTDKTRNSSHFKKVPPYIPIADQDFHEEWNLIQTYKFKNQIQLQIATSWNLRSCRSNSHVHHMNRQGNLLYLWNLYVPREFLTQMHHTLQKVAALFANPTNIMTRHDLPRVVQRSQQI